MLDAWRHRYGNRKPCNPANVWRLETSKTEQFVIGPAETEHQPHGEPLVPHSSATGVLLLSDEFGNLLYRQALAGALKRLWSVYRNYLEWAQVAFHAGIGWIFFS